MGSPISSRNGDLSNQNTGLPNRKISTNNNSSWSHDPNSNIKVFPVVIEKNPGLGFSISGGIGSPINPVLKPNDEGIYVTRVNPNGPASTALRSGDCILQVDDVDFKNVKHSLAVNVLSHSGDVVNMIIAREE